MNRLRRESVTRSLAHLCSLALVVTISLVGGGCGGGTAGTGLQKFSGSVISADNQALPGTIVALAATGAQATADQSGRFLLETTPVDGAPALRVSGQALDRAPFDTEVVVTGVSAEADVEFVIVVDTRRNSASIRDVQIRPRNSDSSSSSRSSSDDDDQDDDDGSSSSSFSDDDDDGSSSSSSSDSDDDDDDSNSSRSSSDDDDDD